MCHPELRSIFHAHPNTSRPGRGAALWPVALACAGWILAACGQDVAIETSGAAAGDLPVGEGLPGGAFLVEAHQAGRAARLGIEGLDWGRLVDVLDQDGVLRHRDFVAGEDLRGDGIDFEFEGDALFERPRVRILHPFASAACVAALERAEANLTEVRPQGPGRDRGPALLHRAAGRRPGRALRRPPGPALRGRRAARRPGPVPGFGVDRAAQVEGDGSVRRRAAQPALACARVRLPDPTTPRARGAPRSPASTRTVSSRSA